MTLSFKDREWKEFFIEDLFHVTIGKNIDGNKINKQGGNTAYITRKESNNGLDGFVYHNLDRLNKDFPVITIGNETAEPFTQKYPFYTGTKVNILKSKQDASALILKFICTSIKSHKSKYSYSYTINSTRLKRQKILLPTNSESEPDYDFMEQYMREKEAIKQAKYQVYITKRLEESKPDNEVEPLNSKEWKEFFIIDVFTDIQRGKRLKKEDHKRGNIPYASSTAMNNGIDGFIGNKEKVRIFNNCLTLANSGSVGATFYQPFEVVASDHVTKLENNALNKYSYLFLANIVSRLGEKYSFNREINDKRIKKEIIMLPINSNNEPDYEYMEQYMKALEYKKLKAYLDWKN